MRTVRRFFVRLANLFSRRRAERDFDSELVAHLALLQEEFERRGMSAEEARREARVRLGGIEQAKELHREARSFTWIEWVWQDVRFALRMQGKDRGSAALALLALSLGIGASAVIFSVVYSVLIEPFPYKNADRLLYIYTHNVRDPGPYGRNLYTVKEFFDFRAQNHVFSAILGGSRMDMTYLLGNTTYQTLGAALEPATFEGLGFKPQLGREITESDAAPGAPPVFVMSDRMWQERFNRDPRILGMTLTVNGVPRTLVAILPPRFLLFRGDIFIPMKITPDLTAAIVGGSPKQPLFVWTVPVLRPGVTLKQAAADMEVITRNEAKIYPDLYPKQFTVNIRTIIDATTSSLQKMIYILLGAELMLLLIACSNVANLLLAKATARERELAVRATLGASRSRLMRQLLSESFVLAVAGATLGCLLAYAGLHGVKAMMPPDTVPEEIDIELNGVALAATVGITVLATLLCGLAPALQAARGDLYERLAGTGKGVGASSGHGALRNALVAAQIGLSIVLLVGAGLMMRTFFALEHVDIGINPNNILAARLVFPNGQYGTAEAKQAFFRQVLRRIGAIPGVTSVTQSLGLPVESGAASSVTVPGTTHPDTWDSDVELVNQDYFQIVGLPLVRGHLFSPADVDSARKVIVVNRKLANDFFGDSDPIGRTIKFDAFDHLPEAPQNAFFEIVGIVGDARNDGLQAAISPEAFMPYTLIASLDNELLVRTSVSPDSVLNNVRQQISAVDQNVALANAGSLESILNRDYFAAPEFGLVLLAVFAAIGLILSAIGVFSVVAYTVSLQTHDIGIRMALGAQPNGVMRMVMLDGLRPILLGVVVGLAASYGLTHLMASLIYGVKATDPWTFTGVVAVLAAVGTAACLLPAWRAMRVDPMVALRHE
jgi:putative ABC transport system permease protein